MNKLLRYLKTFCNGVTELCNGIVDFEKLMEEFNAVAKQLDEVLKDLEWRKPDVEAEEAKLADLVKAAKHNPNVDVASQAIAVRVLRGVLDDKIAEAERLEKRMLELKAQIEAVEREIPRKGKRGKRGKTLHKET